jgi:hypothetical protein
MAATVLSATAPVVTFERALGGQIPVIDPNGQLIGKAELVRGFAHYCGIGAHRGFTCVIRGGLAGLEQELAKGIRNGRDDRS